MNLFCSDHGSIGDETPVQHLLQGHLSGSFVTDRNHPNVFYVLLRSGEIKKTNNLGVSNVLAGLKRRSRRV